MVARYRYRASLLLLCIVVAGLPACVGRQPDDVKVGANGCDEIAIDSVKSYVGIRHNSIAGMARLRGLTGPIVYVNIKAPIHPQWSAVRQTYLFWESEERADVVCKAGRDIYQNPATICGVSVSQTPLRLSMTFGEQEAEPKKRTSEFAEYVKREVLCKPD